MKKGDKLSVTILGISAAIPTKTRHLSGQVVINNNEYFLIDCGEGTQFQLISFGIKYQRIDNIFISHLHGDHFFGLIGLISTYHLLGREKPLNIYAPGPLEESIRAQLKVAHTILSYDLVFHYLTEDSETIIYENESLTIRSFPLVHRVPTFGFRFDQKTKPRNISKTFIEKYKPSVKDILEIKAGSNYIDINGNPHKNKDITTAPPKALSFAHCSDTKFDRSILKYIENVSLLYHESTFDNSMEDKAAEKFHSTAKLAAIIALEANAGNLLLGHFSGRNDGLDILLKEAKEIFDNVTICQEGFTYSPKH